MSKNKKKIHITKGSKSPKFGTIKKVSNPPTLLTNDIYNIEDVNLLNKLNMFPLIIRGKFDEIFFKIEENIYYKFQKEEQYEESYARLDVMNFLKQYDVESGVRLLRSGRENPVIHHGRLINNDIIICTEIYNVPLSKLIEETMYLNEPTLDNIQNKVYKK